MELFDDLDRDATPIRLGDGAVVLPGFAGGEAASLVTALLAVADGAPFRHLVTPGGATMSVAMTNCGRLGWVSDRRGYRYESLDPLTGRPWPAIPAPFLSLAARAAAAAGYADACPDACPDACLVNRYAPGARLALHQDRDEGDLAAPIVSVSLGLPATFLFGGQERSGPVRRLRLENGDVAVWGGASRLAFHGIAPLRPGNHRLTGPVRYNLTFRHVTGLP